MTCTGPGQNPGEPCGRHARSNGLCKQHREQQLRNGVLKPIRVRGRTCAHVWPDGTACGRPHWGQGYCRTHWERKRSGSPPMDAPIRASRPRGSGKKSCEVAGCEGKHRAKGLCSSHWNQYSREQKNPKPAAKSKPAKKKPAPKPVPKPEPEREAWDPAELKHATAAARRRPRPETGYTREVGRVDPPTEDQVAAIRRLCGDQTDHAGGLLVEYLLGVAA